MNKELLEYFDPVQGETLQVLDDEGRVLNSGWKPDIPDELAVEALKKMLYVRMADQLAVSYQRQGRMYTYPPNFGQEAIGVTAGMFMRAEDWLVPAYRELGAWLAKGATMKDIFLLFAGHEDGHRMPGAPNMLPSAVPIASQLLHAAGIGYALKYRRQPGMVFTFVGDGGTSQGDFHEALNFAAVWRAPVVFICQNNQYAISCHLSKQTASRSIAIKALAYGMPGIRVDGNDFFALYAALTAIDTHIREGRGPVLLEAVTYRRGAHTTSDDPGRYRTAEEERSWEKRDPVRRLRAYLLSSGKWEAGQEEILQEQFRRDIDAQFMEVDQYPPYQLEDVFIHHFATMPDHLKRQMVEYQKYQNWEASRR